MRLAKAYERHGIRYTAEQFARALQITEVWRSDRGTYHVQELERGRRSTTLCGSLNMPEAEVVATADNFYQYRPGCGRCALGLELRRSLAVG